jgi:hypothetical protein
LADPGTGTEVRAAYRELTRKEEQQGRKFWIKSDGSVGHSGTYL